jgi:hypothetical protein
LAVPRPGPTANIIWRLAAGSLSSDGADGSAMRLEAGGLVTILSHAGFSSVAISLPEGRLKAIGAVTAAIEIAPLTSIVPVAMAGDSNPQTPAEIGYATNTERRLAQSAFELKPDQRCGETHYASHQCLPADEPTSQVGREAVWKNAVMQAASAPLDPQGFAIASRLYQRCGAAVDSARLLLWVSAWNRLSRTQWVPWNLSCRGGAPRGPLSTKVPAGVSGKQSPES